MSGAEIAERIAKAIEEDRAYFERSSDCDYAARIARDHGIAMVTEAHPGDGHNGFHVVTLTCRQLDIIDTALDVLADAEGLPAEVPSEIAALRTALMAGWTCTPPED